MALSTGDGETPSNEKERRHRELAKAYQNRYRAVNEARGSLEITLLEVEVLWGDEWLALVRKLYNWDGELYAAIMDRLDDVINEPEVRRDPGDIAHTRKIINSRSDKKKDEFLSGLQQAISDVEKKVKPHLKRFT